MVMNTPRKQIDNEEPELGADESVPLDGKDPVGEGMMKDLGRDMKRNREAAEGFRRSRSGESDESGKEDEDDPGPLPEQFPAS
jgi:hypothetical protein